MLLFAVFLALAILLMLLAPRALTLSPWQIRRPRLALSFWFGAFFLSVAALIAATLAAIYAEITAERPVDDWSSIFVTIIAWVSLFLLGGFLALIVTANEPLIESQRRTRAQLTPAGATDGGDKKLRVSSFESEEYFAYALPGKQPQILVSSPLISALNRQQLQAVLAHEYAHLQQRHHWAMRIAEVNARCLPRIRAGQKLKRATMLLIELIADDTAAKQVGPAPLANALSRLGSLSHDEAMQIRAERLTGRSWPAQKRRRIPETITNAFFAPDTLAP
ncbi:MAG: M56 family metallopeptidase [Microbacteriaceae bacterium]